MTSFGGKRWLSWGRKETGSVATSNPPEESQRKISSGASISKKLKDLKTSLALPPKEYTVNSQDNTVDIFNADLVDVLKDIGKDIMTFGGKNMLLYRRVNSAHQSNAIKQEATDSKENEKVTDLSLSPSVRLSSVTELPETLSFSDNEDDDEEEIENAETSYVDESVKDLPVLSINEFHDASVIHNSSQRGEEDNAGSSDDENGDWAIDRLVVSMSEFHNNSIEHEPLVARAPNDSLCSEFFDVDNVVETLEEGVTAGEEKVDETSAVPVIHGDNTPHCTNES